MLFYYYKALLLFCQCPLGIPAIYEMSIDRHVHKCHQQNKV